MVDPAAPIADVDEAYAPPLIMLSMNPPPPPCCSCANTSVSSSSFSSRGFWSISSSTCIPALPSSTLDSEAWLAFSATPSTRVMTSPGRKSTAGAERGESGAASTPLVS